MIGMSTFKTIASAAILSLGLASAAQALPALQLGPDPDNLGSWNYDLTTETWVLGTGNGSVYAYANDTKANGGDGHYAWDSAGAAGQIAYLVVSAMPGTADGTDAFNISVTNDGGALSLFDSGYGTPPLEDSNSISSHGIFDTYFEIYAFNFDGLSGTIGNTQPGDAGSGEGFTEEFDVVINSYTAGTTGIHFDLFTTTGAGQYLRIGDTGYGGDNKKLVNRVAPYSHDAEFGCCGENVPEPGPLGLLGAGMIALYIARRRRLAS